MHGRRIDFEALANQLLQQAHSLLPQWLPSGRFDGREFKVGNLQGEPGDSLSINTDTGVWADFASGSRGGDLIDLYAAIHGIKLGDAARQLGATVTDAPAATKPKPQAARRGTPPPDAPEPSFIHPKHGKASRHWTYRDRDGNIIGHISRHDTPDGKQIIPWTWDLDRRCWRNLALPEPRPLYGLELLTQRPNAPVLLVEGEKAADAAREIAGKVYVVVTWPGGVSGIRKIDWTPLRGRKLLLWPDADCTHTYPAKHRRAGEVMDYVDQPGPRCMLALADQLLDSCEQVKIIDAHGQPDGWDAADALAEGWDWAQLAEWAKPRASLFERPAPPEPEPEPERDPAPEPEPPPDEDRNRSWVGSWLDMGLQLNGNGAPLMNLANAVTVLEKHPALQGHIWYDEFRVRMFTDWAGELRQWADSDDSQLALWLQRAIGLSKISSGIAHEAAVLVAKANTRNECRQWMESLKWDGQERLPQLMATGFGAEASEYAARVGECWVMSMVARVFKPGCKVDYMPVFEGSQGIGKSTALRVLGSPWFTECHESVLTKDFYGVLQGALIVEISEMHCFGKAEVERIKGVITCQSDRYRAPYGRNTEDHPRQSVFAGTTNRYDWNKDETGARRFWPIRCLDVRLGWLEDNRDQLFAEAVTKFQEGLDWWGVPADAAAAEQEARRAADSWEDTIRDWLSGQMTYDMTIAQVLSGALRLEPSKQDRVSQMRAASALRILGWESQVIRQGGRVHRVWRCTQQEN